MQNTVILSYIIPAYNAAKTLTRAVDSIISGSSISNWEIIIVENGSTDNTNLVAKEITKKYKNDRIRIFHSIPGVSNARNVGIRAAIGKWIVFVDADDYMDMDNLKLLCYDAISEKADMYIYGHEAGKNKIIVNDSTDKEYYTEKEIEKLRVKMLENPTRYLQVWAKLFRRDIICNNNIYFNPNLRLSEDSDFTIRYLEYCLNICLCNSSVYHYSLTSASTMRTYDGNKVNDYENAMEITKQYILTQNEKIQTAYYKYILMHLNIVLVREIFCIQNPEKYVEKVKRMKRIVKRKIFYDAIISVKIKEAFKPRLIPIFLMKHNLYYLASIIYLIRVFQNYFHEKSSER